MKKYRCKTCGYGFCDIEDGFGGFEYFSCEISNRQYATIEDMQNDCPLNRGE